MKGQARLIYLKLVAYIVFTFCLFYFKNINISYAVFALAFVIYWFYPDRRIRKGVVPISIFTLSVFVSNLLLFSPGKIIMENALITITDSAMELAIVRGARVIGLVYGAKLLVISTGAEEIVSALKRIFSPLKRFGLSVDSFFDTVTLTLRLLPVIKEEALKRVDREKKRRPDTLFLKLRVWIDVMVPLLLDTIRMPEIFIKNTPEQHRN